MWQDIIKQLLASSWLEIIAMVCGLLFPIFASYEKKICWLFGGISAIIYVWLMYDVKLYQDAIINIYYVVMAVIGYLTWTGVIRNKKTKLEISTLPIRDFILLLILGLVYTVFSGYFFNRFTDASYPYIDAFVTGFAFIATWLGARKKIENWYLLLLIDAICIWLFWKKGYILTSVLNIIYCIICIQGIIQWNRKIRLSK